MKKRWIVIPVVAGLTALVVTGGAIFAHGFGSGPGGKAEDVTNRAAEILGIEPSVLKDAFRQAIDEQHEAALQKKLARLVDRERITQEEADAVLAWFQDKPDAAAYVPGIILRSEEWVQRVLNRLVEAERITQDEADLVLAWFLDRPEVLEDFSAFHRREGRGRFQGHFRGRFEGRIMPGVPGMDFRHRGNTNGEILQQDLRIYTPEFSTNGVLQ